jgi:hypothetical protein
MFRPLFGVKAIAVAIGIVATAGVAAAATVTQAPAADVAVAPQVEARVPDVAKSVAEVPVPALPDLTGLLGSLPTPTVPSLPSVPKVPSVPGLPTGSLPVDPTEVAGAATETVAQVMALLPTSAELQAAVMGCVSDLTALVPVPVPSAADPLGGLLGFLGVLGNLGGGAVPAAPDPAAVQAAVAGCVADVLGLLPDPTALAQALTASFGGSIPEPVAAILDLLLGEAGGLPDAQHLLDLVTALTSATGSPAAILHELTGVLEAALPPQLAGLVALPLSIVDQVFASIGLA